MDDAPAGPPPHRQRGTGPAGAEPPAAAPAVPHRRGPKTRGRGRPRVGPLERSRLRSQPPPHDRGSTRHRPEASTPRSRAQRLRPRPLKRGRCATKVCPRGDLRTSHTPRDRSMSGLTGSFVRRRARSDGPASRSRCALEIRSAEKCRSCSRCWCRVPAPRPRPSPTGIVGGHQAGDAADQEIRYPPGTRSAQCSSSARPEVRRRQTCSGWEPSSSRRHPAS
jgi:hypothetical protein